MIALAIQCPSCGLSLRHAGKLLSRVDGRRGTTRCPRCRDRIHFDATGPYFEISFPDLYEEATADRAANIRKETAPPPHLAEDRESGILATNGDPTSSSTNGFHIPDASLESAALPSDLSIVHGHEPAADDELFANEDEPVFPLVLPRRLRQG